MSSISAGEAALRSIGLPVAAIDGQGATSAPDLTRIGAQRDAAYLRKWIADPATVDEFSSMPPFKDVLTPGQMDALVAHLAARK